MTPREDLQNLTSRGGWKRVRDLRFAGERGSKVTALRKSDLKARCFTSELPPKSASEIEVGFQLTLFLKPKMPHSPTFGRPIFKHYLKFGASPHGFEAGPLWLFPGSRTATFHLFNPITRLKAQGDQSSGGFEIDIEAYAREGDVMVNDSEASDTILKDAYERKTATNMHRSCSTEYPGCLH